MYYLYIRVTVSVALSCSPSEQKPSLRQRHRLLASNAESRIRLIVLLTASKIFAISSITDKKTNRNFARLSAWWLRLGGTPTPETKTYSERTYKRNLRLRRRNTSRNGGEHLSAEQDGCTSDCAVLLRSRRTKRGGTTRGRYLSMRVPTVFPASDG